MSDAGPRVKVPFVYHVCNDIETIRHFYVDLLGMQQAAHMDTPDFGYLALECGGLQMMWFRADEKLPVPDAFACQPGWAGGTLDVSSFSAFVPEEDFMAVFERLRDAGTTMFKPEPEWRQDSYWGLSVLDPMGATVEVYTTPKDRPSDTTWPS